MSRSSSAFRRGLARPVLLAGLSTAILATAVAATLALRSSAPASRYDAAGRRIGAADAGLPRGAARNVILVSIDTLRADVLGLGGNTRRPSPHLDRFSRSAVTFADCISSAPHTDPAHATMFTGLYPRSHGVHDHTRRLSPEVTTLAEILAAQGFRTAAIVNSPKFHRAIGLDQGFEHYALVAPYETEPWLDAVLEYLETPPQQPLFLFLHVLDPHAPYKPPAALREVYHPFYAGPFDGHISRLKYRNGGAKAVASNLIGLVRAWYEAEVLEVDAALGRVLGRLEQLGLLEDSVVVVVSDHGEELLDHGGLEHSHTLFDELVRVPLLVRAPGWPQGAVARAQVRTVDLLPTLLSLVGLPPPAGLPGVPLDPASRAETGPAVSERSQGAQVAWRSRGEKLLYDLENHKVVDYFRLDHDPAERTGRVKHAYDRVEELSAEVERWAAETRPAPAAESSLDEATREAIEALGYVGH